jgi:hypothetical protein
MQPNQITAAKNKAELVTTLPETTMLMVNDTSDAATSSKNQSDTATNNNVSAVSVEASSNSGNPTDTNTTSIMSSSSIQLSHSNDSSNDSATKTGTNELMETDSEPNTQQTTAKSETINVTSIFTTSNSKSRYLKIDHDELKMNYNRKITHGTVLLRIIY